MKNKKKILILNYEFPPLGGGASYVSYELAKEYVSLGNKVSVVTMGYKDLLKFEIKDEIKIYRVKCFRLKKEICHPWEQLTYLYSARKFLKKHLKKNKYDINHTHFIIPTGVLAIWTKKNFNIPYIITAHGSDVLGYNNKRFFKYLYPFLNGIWKKIIKDANALISPSEFLLDKINNITNDGNFFVIPNGLKESKFKPMKKEKKILVVSRLFENKGIQDVLDALKGIDMRGWVVDIVGEGPYRSFLENKVSKNNLNKIVKFHGWIDNESQEMKNFYGKAGIFISASWFESFGLTLIEAISAKCQILVSDIDGHRQIIKNDKCFFRKRDIINLKQKINDAIDNNNSFSGGEIDKKFELNNIAKEYISKMV